MWFVKLQYDELNHSNDHNTKYKSKNIFFKINEVPGLYQRRCAFFFLIK